MTVDNTSYENGYISVCICTYMRPEMLNHALEGVLKQITNGRFTFEVVVVDNDYNRSAEHVVLENKRQSDIPITYQYEPEQNIALARNRAIASATGTLIAFMDDDEYPVKDWLIRLYDSMILYKADGVLGPVLPSFQKEAPRWIKKKYVFNRRRFKSGTRLTSHRDTRTGNVLISRSIMEGSNVWFDPQYGLSGGEDIDFFKSQLAFGRIFIWCNEAIVYETIPEERMKSLFHIKKYFKIGSLTGKTFRNNGVPGFVGFMKSIISLPIWVLLLIILLPFGKQFWMLPVLKINYATGCILSYSGLSFNTQRY